MALRNTCTLNLEYVLTTSGINLPDVETTIKKEIEIENAYFRIINISPIIVKTPVAVLTKTAAETAQEPTSDQESTSDQEPATETDQSAEQDPATGSEQEPETEPEQPAEQDPTTGSDQETATEPEPIAEPETATVYVEVYDANKENKITVKSYKGFIPCNDDGAENIIKQGYEFLKTLDDFKAAQNVLEEGQSV